MLHIFSEGSKRLLIFFVIYLFFSLLATSSYFLGNYLRISDFELVHQGLIAGEGQAPYQFRVISYWLPEMVSRIFGCSVTQAYFFLFFIFNFIIFCLFHIYLLKWFDEKISFIGVLLLLPIIQISFTLFLNFADSLHLLLFLIGLFLIREKKLIYLYSLLFIGTFNKEALIFLIIFYFIVSINKKNKTKIIIHFFGFSTSWLIAMIITRFLFYPYQGYDFWQIQFNLNSLLTWFRISPLTNIYLLPVYIFGIFWILSFCRYKEKPLFIRRGLIFMIVFLILHLFITRIYEIHVLLPLVFLIVPPSLMFLFPDYSLGKKKL